MKRWKWMGLMVLLALTQVRMNAQMCHLAMGSEREEVAPEKLPVAVKLGGIGNGHIKISGSAEAQMWFDQGLNLLHDFWDYESEKAFEQGVRVDPKCAMCYWGLYQAEMFRHSNSKQYAREALKKAVEFESHASKAERLYIEAAAAGDADEEKKDKKTGETEQVRLLRKLVKENPHDLQAKIFLAETVTDGYDDAGEPKPGKKEALAILQSVMKAAPEDSAANHYWIHAVEASPKPEQALHSAAILGRLAPTSGHMVHMPGHIFYRTGDYTSAKASFAASMKADESYMDTYHVAVDDDWNYVHNTMYAIANLMEMGRLQEATEISAKLLRARGELESTLYPWSARDQISRIDVKLPVALRTGDWGQVLELLKTSEPEQKLPNLHFMARQLRDFAAGMQALELHDLAKAEEFSVRLDAELWRTSQRLQDEEEAKKKEKKKDDGSPTMQVMPDGNGEALVKTLSIMSLELRAGMLVENRQVDESKKLYAQAAQEEKALGYREPPGFIRPVAETEAAALLSAGDWAGAKQAYKKALSERPRSGFPLYGIALTSEKAGEAQAARTEYTKFLEEWKDADAGLTEMRHAKEFASGREASGN